MATRRAIFAGLLVLAVPTHGTTRCRDACYQIDAPLDGPVEPAIPWVHAVTLDGGRFALSTDCDQASIAAPRPRNGRTLTATLSDCLGLRGAVRLKGRLSSDCKVVTGTVHTRHGRPRTRRLYAALSTCGDSRVDNGCGEECDGAVSCGNGRRCEACRCLPLATTTTSPPPPVTPTVPQCGNGLREGTEQCDGRDLGNMACQLLGFDGGGLLLCKPDCTFNTANCARCGDNRWQEGEKCDGTDPGPRHGDPSQPANACQDFGFPEGGVLACNGTCDAWDFNGCYVCNNGRLEPGEECDGPNLHGHTCPVGNPDLVSCTSIHGFCRVDDSACQR